jgi:hypothetical protein
MEISTGVHYDLPFEQYLKVEAMSKSRLWDIEKCEQNYYLNHIAAKEEEEEKVYFVEGRALHTAVLEPELFDAQFAVAPKVDKRTKAGKAEFAAFELNSQDKSVLTVEQYDKIMFMGKSVMGHPKAGAMILAGQKEISIINECPYYELLRKGRIDLQADDIIADLKSTSLGAGPSSVKRQIFNLGYYLQAAMYMEMGRIELEVKPRHFVFIFVESAKPYFTGVYIADDVWIRAGMSKYRDLMDRYLTALGANYWPQYNNDEIVEISPERWMINQIDESMSDNF